MIPLSYGIVNQVNHSEVSITWDDLTEASYSIKEINKGQMMIHGKPVGVGIYTEDQYEGA